jgi:hypothetical protein
MTQEAAARVLHLVTEPQSIHLVPPEYERGLRERIHRAELASMQTEQERINKGMRLYDGPMARLWVPPAPIRTYHDRHVGPGEMVEIWEGTSMIPYQLVRGDTTYLRWRRRWDIFPEIVKELQAKPELGLSDEKRWALLYDLFDVAYGVMACCRMDIQSVPHVLCGIRSGQLDTKNVGMLSFPAGTVKPFETLETAVRRELLHEGFVQIATSYPGWVRYNFPDVPSMTFGRLMEAKTQGAMPKDGCFEVQGKTFIWVRQSDIACLIAGDATPVISRFEERGISIAVSESTGKQELGIAADARLTFSAFMGLGM